MAYLSTDNSSTEPLIAEKKRRERERNDEKDKYIKLQQDIRSISDTLHGSSRCKYDKVEAGSFNDDTIYVAEQIIEKFYPKANSPRAVTEDEMTSTFSKLRGRKYYEEKEFGSTKRFSVSKSNFSESKLSNHKRKIVERVKKRKLRIVT